MENNITDVIVRNKLDKVNIKKRVITDALKRCLNNSVYSKITVQDIADEAGYSKGGLLHYFPNKEDIYLCLIEDVFGELDKIHDKMLEGGTESGVMAQLSALLGVESFIGNQTTVKVVVNLLLFSLEEEKIMLRVREKISRHRSFYNNVLKNDPRIDKGLARNRSLSRIVQTIVMFVGFLELVDPIEIDHLEIVDCVLKILKGK